MLIAFRPTASSSSRVWQITLRVTSTTFSPNASPRGFLCSTTCSQMGTGVEPRHWWQVHLDQERPLLPCISYSLVLTLGEQGIYATFQENPVQLERIVQGFSWSFNNPMIELMFRPPVDLYVDEWVYEILDAIERTGATRLAIDSLGDLPHRLRRRNAIPRVHVLIAAKVRPARTSA